MDKRYQVFVSSTYADLQEERQEVMQALLELDCIPAGMELFPAANEDQWTLIKKVIDDCDYYLVIIAGRYGSLGPDGQSYTEMEYRYALERGKPVIGFLHKEPGNLAANRSESDAEGKAKLEAFGSLVKGKMCRFWDSPADLGNQVSRSLVKLIKSSPAVGWVKADLVPDQSAAEEILGLNKQIELLKRELESARTTAPPGIEGLAKGSDEFLLEFDFESSNDDFMFDRTKCSGTDDATWNDIFAAVSPAMIDKASDDQFRALLNDLITRKALPEIQKREEFASDVVAGVVIRQDSFNKIKVQLRALGLIVKNEKYRSVKDTNTYWTLTPYGDTVMTQLLALPKPVAAST